MPDFEQMMTLYRRDESTDAQNKRDLLCYSDPQWEEIMHASMELLLHAWEDKEHIGPLLDRLTAPEREVERMGDLRAYAWDALAPLRQHRID